MMCRSLAVFCLLISVLAFTRLTGWAEPSIGDQSLEFFRRQTLRVDADRLRDLIQRLGDDSFAVREESADTLTKLGRLALPALEQTAINGDELEVRRLATTCINRINTGFGADRVIRAAEDVARHKPAGAADVLLDYCPQIVDERALTAVIDTLSVLAVRDRRVDPVIVHALEEGPSLRRAAAAVAVLRSDNGDHLTAIKALLVDKDVEVRFRVAKALLARHDKDSLPVLIGLLDKISRTRLVEVEELLFRLADDTSPDAPYGSTAEERGQFRTAWQKWWSDHGDNVKLPHRPPEFVDRTLVVMLDLNTVVDLDSEDKPRFTIEKMNFPLDAQYLPGDRVLVAEHQAGRVSERHRSGVILWEKMFSGPLAAQRLANGHTFMASKTSLLEVDRLGREIWGFAPQQSEEFMRASKLPNGDIAVILMDRARFRQRLVIMDAVGKEKKTFQVFVNTFGGRLDVQSNGNILVPQHTQDVIVEYDSNGKTIREFHVNQPIVAMRLANGHTVATSMSENRAIEFDAVGKEIWEYRQPTRVTRCLRR
jgi:hypothetical protein